MSSTQGHTNINTTYTTIDISSILSEINRIADETYLRGVEEGHRIANMERADLLDKVADRLKAKVMICANCEIIGCDTEYFKPMCEKAEAGIFAREFSEYVDEVIAELKAKIEK